MTKLAPYAITHSSALPSFAQKQKEAVKKETKQQQYNDPLMSWPIRGLAYSNELGAAISEVAPKLGTLLWFPAMLYFGADIYDKYKNEKTSLYIYYNTSRAKRQRTFPENSFTYLYNLSFFVE